MVFWSMVAGVKLIKLLFVQMQLVALIMGCIECITDMLLQWVFPAWISGKGRKKKEEGWFEVTKETEHQKPENLRWFQAFRPLAQQ